MNNPNLKIFLVEFGAPDLNSFLSNYGNQKPLFVIAETYDQAVSKAMCFAENNSKSDSVLDRDGSLRISEENILQVKSVKVVSNEIIM